MLDKIALLLAIVGGLNWGLMGIFQLDAVAWLFGGQGSIFSRVIYTLVALGGFSGCMKNEARRTGVFSVDQMF